MRIPWNIAAWFGLIWAVGALLSFAWGMASGDFSALHGSAGASSQLLDAQLSPSNVVLDSPTLGEGVSSIEGTFAFLLPAYNWTKFAINALALDYEFLGTNRWLITGRWILLAFAAPLAINLAIIGWEIMSNMIRGVSSIAIPFLGRFRFGG
jgi:hypothetical protein